MTDPFPSTGILTDFRPLGLFPQTPVLDNFNRADTGPPPSASWTNHPDYGGSLVVDTNKCKAENGGACAAYWNTLLGPDSEAYFTLSTLQVANSIYCFIRADPTLNSGYWIEIVPDGTINLKRAAATLDTASVTLGAGDSFGIRALGSNITGRYKPSGGSWSEILSGSDATTAGAGYIGLFVQGDTTARMDDFGGGNISLGPPPTADYGNGLFSGDMIVSNGLCLREIAGNNSDAPYITRTFALPCEAWITLGPLTDAPCGVVYVSNGTALAGYIVLWQTGGGETYYYILDQDAATIWVSGLNEFSPIVEGGGLGLRANRDGSLEVWANYDGSAWINIHTQLGLTIPNPATIGLGLIEVG